MEDITDNNVHKTTASATFDKEGVFSPLLTRFWVKYLIYLLRRNVEDTPGSGQVQHHDPGECIFPHGGLRLKE
jgi:hypothetical protein